MITMFFQVAYAQKNESKRHELTVDTWKFDGHIGQYVDRIVCNRILGADAWNKIYPETEDAFRLREDDSGFPDYGRWRGEFWGKYILSAIEASKYYGDSTLKKRVKQAVDGLLSTRDENGYLGTYKRSDYVTSNTWNVWNRKYTLWGLIAASEFLEEDYILDGARQLMDHLISEVGPEKIAINKTGNFYGMPSMSILQPVVKLYKNTHDIKYLQYAHYIVDQWDSNIDGVPGFLIHAIGVKPVHQWFEDIDPYRWAKGYEFLSCIEGLLELYEVTNKESYLAVAENIHEALLKWERNPVGNLSFDDKLVGSASLMNSISEVCDAVYWNRLSHKLFLLTRKAKYLEEIERTLYNSLLTSSNSKGDWGLRRIRMSHIHVPATNHFLLHHQCCTDNLPRGLFDAAQVALTSERNKLFLSLYNEGVGMVRSTTGQPIVLRVSGDFLTTRTSTVTISLDKPERFELNLRMPSWSVNTGIAINGKMLTTRGSKSWESIDRVWKKGDIIQVKFELTPQVQVFHSKDDAPLKHPLLFYKQKWADVAYVQGGNTEFNLRYSHVKPLSVADALPNAPAIVIRYGPLVLARDVRVTEGDIFAPIAYNDDGNTGIEITEVDAPAQIWKAFELTFEDGQKVKFCDFSSAGNTWDFSSKFNTWCFYHQ